MREALRRAPLERVVHVALAATIVAVSFGSNWSPSVRSVAQPIWRAALVALCALSLAYAWSRRADVAPGARARLAYALAAALAAVAVVSAAWSVDPKLTVARGGAFALVLATAAALAHASAGDRARVARLLLAVLAGAVAVAVLGLVLLAAFPHDVFQVATPNTPSRYRGVGQNANTVAMLFAVSLPIAVWRLFVPGRRRYALAAIVLLFGSIVASASRGGLVGALVGSLVVAVALAGSARARIAAAAATAAVVALGVAVTRIQDPASPEEAGQSPGASANVTGKGPNAERFFRLQDEIGSPPTAAYSPPTKRGVLGSSGRGQAWQGAIDQAEGRAGLGYGFGTEDSVFVDRYYSFYGGVPENSYIGMFLQLGAVGVVLLVALLAVLAAAAVSALGSAPAAPVVAAVVLVAATLAAVQSYVYSAGNTATLAVWICGFAALALGPAR